MHRDFQVTEVSLILSGQRNHKGLENSLKLMPKKYTRILWDTAKTVFGRKFIGSNTSIKKKNISNQ